MQEQQLQQPPRQRSVPLMQQGTPKRSRVSDQDRLSQQLLRERVQTVRILNERSTRRHERERLENANELNELCQTMTMQMYQDTYGRQRD
jgi:hypothetical protein